MQKSKTYVYYFLFLTIIKPEMGQIVDKNKICIENCYKTEEMVFIYNESVRTLYFATRSIIRS